MSVCSNSFRVLSRHYAPTPRTLVPFLYQTATIQQWKPAARPIARRNASSRSNHDDDIPFESDALPPAIDDAKPSRQTTITGSERAAFEQLYRKFNNSTKPPRSHPRHEIDQIADEWYEEDEDNDPSAASLDSLFDAALSRKRAASKNRLKVAKMRRGQRDDGLATLAAEILKPEADRERNKGMAEGLAKAARIKNLKSEERARVKALLEGAQTDKELWDVLETEVFGVIRRMDLDKQNETTKKGKGKGEQKKITAPSSQPKASTTPTDTPVSPARHDPAVLFPNVSFYLILAAQNLRKNFPSSPLPMSIIPTLKSLGRSSYALGATTQLYKILIRTAWVQNQSYTQITSLLQDMDNGGIECDYGILNMLDEIISEHRMARRGKLGKAMQVVLGMEQFEEGIKLLREWRETVAKRLGAWSERRVGQGGIVRKVGKGRPALNPTGPKDELMIRDPAAGGLKVAGPDDISLVEGPVEEAMSNYNPVVESMLRDDEDDQKHGGSASAEQTHRKSEVQLAS